MSKSFQPTTGLGELAPPPPLRDFAPAKGPTRRRWMVGAAGALLIPLTIAHWTRGRGHQDVSALLPVELESVLGHETVLRIGELRRIQQSRPAGMQELADALRRSATALGDAADPQTPISERLRSVAMAEMRAGRIVVVDGWIVSETEARQCELSHLAAR